MDTTTLVWALTVLFLVLALIFGLAWLVRRFGWAGAPVRGARGRRLAVVEVAPIDMKRRLVLVRRDEIEHLVLLGPNSETVVERGITAPDRFDVMINRSGKASE